MLGTFGYEESYDDIDIIEDYSYGFKGASGLKASYRIYRKEEAKGLFLQAEFGLLNYIWGHKKENSDWTDVNTFVYIFTNRYVAMYVDIDRLSVNENGPPTPGRISVTRYHITRWPEQELTSPETGFL